MVLVINYQLMKDGHSVYFANNFGLHFVIFVFLSPVEDWKGMLQWGLSCFFDPDNRAIQGKKYILTFNYWPQLTSNEMCVC